MFLTRLLFVLTSAIFAVSKVQAFEIDYSASNAYTDYQPTDGQFDDGQSSNNASTAWWPVFGGTGNNLWRPAFEFDIAGLAVVENAVLTVTYDFVLYRTTEIELHGYVGDGVVTRTDVLIDNLLSTIALPQKSSLPLVDLSFNVTTFVQALVNNGDLYAGFSIRLADEGFSGELLTNIWTGRVDTAAGDGLGRGPQLSIATVPVPATLSLVMFGIAVISYRTRQWHASIPAA